MQPINACYLDDVTNNEITPVTILQFVAGVESKSPMAVCVMPDHSVQALSIHRLTVYDFDEKLKSKM